MATDLTSPWGLAFLPDGRALVAARDSGRILIVPAAGGTPTEVTTLPVRHRSEGGLLGLAVSPRFDQDHRVYAYYTSAADNRVVRFQLDGDRAGAPENVLTGLRAAPNHNGGRIAFGPDGQLYVAVGDAGEPATAQDPTSLNGKILRITADGGIPADNPDPSSGVYSLGHRNVQGLAWDSAGRLWASEFGQNTFDEINLIRPGGNYGWPVVEGTGDPAGGRYTNPQVTWSTDEASPSGIAIRDDVLYVAALRGERLWVMDLADGRVAGAPRALFTGELGRLRTVEPAPDGSLWLITSNTDGRGTPGAGDDRILALR
ncbi:glucose sorbosone dehydrogenase [Frankia sp. R43]|uniref:PQQ-dependent sugar dehydrogenase n=1 Tax=Frankia sp. R43 TaxID=269536 RepID=UPI0006C9E7AF|nr:PQQ-dependent sugar dehydrogenase [Frankia sp. R43]KPM53640.1 glucose sorbosone dehydrogenase [Frankia sp. R43]